MLLITMKFIKCVLQSNNANNTEQLAASLAKNIKGGEVLQLVSDLGGGKTTFTRGFARGLQSKDVVSSPTFTVSNQYQGNKFNIYHFDFYRLQDPGIVANELKEATEEPNAVVIIEWADVVQDVLPEDTVKINFEPSGDTTRTIIVHAPVNKLYLLEGLIV